MGAARAATNIPTTNSQLVSEPGQAPTPNTPPSAPKKRKRGESTGLEDPPLPYQAASLWIQENPWEEPYKRKAPKLDKWKPPDMDEGIKLVDSFVKRRITIRTLDLDDSFRSLTKDTPLVRAKRRASVFVQRKTDEYYRMRLFAFLSYVLVLRKTKLILPEDVSDILSSAGIQGSEKHHADILGTTKRLHQLAIGMLHGMGWPLSQATLFVASMAPLSASSYRKINTSQIDELRECCLKISQGWGEKGHSMVSTGNDSDESIVDLIRKWELALQDYDQKIRTALGYPFPNEWNATNGNQLVWIAVLPTSTNTTNTTEVPLLQSLAMGNSSTRFQPLGHIAREGPQTRHIQTASSDMYAMTCSPTNTSRSARLPTIAGCAEDFCVSIAKIDKFKIFGAALAVQEASIYPPVQHGFDFKLEMRVPLLKGQALKQTKQTMQSIDELRDMLGDCLFKAMVASKRMRENSILGFVGSAVNIMRSGEKVVVMMEYERGLELCRYLRFD